MLAVFVNCGAIIIGSLIGILFSRKISNDLSGVVTTAAGIITCILGFQMAFKYQNIIYLALALILGGVVGNALNIDGKILAFGRMLERRLYHSKVQKQASKRSVNQESDKLSGSDNLPNDNNLSGSDKLSSKEPHVNQIKPNFAYAFLNSSVLFCVGAMAILGSFQAGINKDYTIIFTKSVLDGFMAIVFAASMGVGTAFSVVTIFLYQGALTLLSTVIAPYVSDNMIAELTGSGGAMIIMIGINLLDIKKIKTANYLPALIFSVIFVLLDPYIGNIFG